LDAKTDAATTPGPATKQVRLSSRISRLLTISYEQRIKLKDRSTLSIAEAFTACVSEIDELAKPPSRRL
jgi:hypothetical protein